MKNKDKGTVEVMWAVGGKEQVDGSGLVGVSASWYGLQVHLLRLIA